jgi:hypothetical protein
MEQLRFIPSLLAFYSLAVRVPLPFVPLVVAGAEKRRIDSSPAARFRATSQRISACRCPRFIDGYRRQQDHREQGKIHR